MDTNHFGSRKKRQMLYILATMFIAAILSMASCQPRPTQPNPYQISVSTPHNLNVYDPGQTISFDIRLTKGANPVGGEIVGVIDPITAMCNESPRTDEAGNTQYSAIGDIPGQYSFGFWSPDGQEFANYVVFVRETALNDSFHVLGNPNPPTLAFGANQAETKETFSQKAGEVATNTIIDGMTNPVFLGTGLLCLGGIAAMPITGGGSAAVSAVACPVAYNVFMGNLLLDVTRNSVEKFVDDPVQKERSLQILQVAEITQSVMSFNDAIVNSPKGGKGLPEYNIESYQGRAAAQRALTRMTDVQDAINTLTEQTVNVTFLNENALVLNMYLHNGGPSENYDQCHVVTIGIGRIQQGGAVNVAGSWNGVLLMPEHGYAPLYTYSMNLTQTNSQVVGTTRCEIPNTQYFVAKQVSGHTAGTQVFLHDVAIDSQRTPLFTYWLMITDTLSLNQWSDSLNGPWMSQSYYTGTIHLARQ